MLCSEEDLFFCIGLCIQHEKCGEDFMHCWILCIGKSIQQEISGEDLLLFLGSIECALWEGNCIFMVFFIFGWKKKEKREENRLQSDFGLDRV